MKCPNCCNEVYDELIEKVTAWWDEVYPEQIFPVVSEIENRDTGAIKVSEIRALLDKIKTMSKLTSNKPKVLNKPDYEGAWLRFVNGEWVATQVYLHDDKLFFIDTYGNRWYNLTNHKWVKAIMPVENG